MIVIVSLYPLRHLHAETFSWKLTTVIVGCVYTYANKCSKKLQNMIYLTVIFILMRYNAYTIICLCNTSHSYSEFHGNFSRKFLFRFTLE